MYTDKEIQVSPSEYKLWRNLPTTIAIFDALMDERSVVVQRIVLGDTLERAGSEIRDTARAIGTVEGLTIILEDMELALQQQWADAEQMKMEQEMEGEESGE
jgi:hypothetical protein